MKSLPTEKLPSIIVPEIHGTTISAEDRLPKHQAYEFKFKV
jgi:hypothetical protein